MTNLLALTAGAFVVVFLLAGTGINAKVHLHHPVGRSSRIALPSVPFTDDYLKKSQMIFHAIETLYVPLWQLRWQFTEASKTNARKSNSNAFVDLCGVLNHFKVETNYKNRKLPENFKKMQVLSKAFVQMYAMRTEVSHQSYSVGCFESDAKALIDVAKYLDDLRSGQTNTTETSGESSTTRRGLIGERSDGGSRGRSQSLVDRSRSGRSGQTTTERSGESSTTRRGLIGERADGGSLRRSQSISPRLSNNSPTLELEMLMALGISHRPSGRIDDKCSGRSSKIVECSNIDSSHSNSGRLLG